jgi:drug/metabolite transporter (DMT)-like permease
VSGRFVAGSAIAMAGVALLFLQEVRAAGTSTGDVLKGLGFVLVAVLAASGSNVMQLMPAVRGRPIAPMLGWAMLYGALLDGSFAWVFVGPPVLETRAGYWIGLLYLGLVASSLAFWLYYEIIRKVGPARAAYSSVLIPIIAMLISTVAEDYVWSPLALAGAALGVAGLIVALRAGQVPPRPAGD